MYGKIEKVFKMKKYILIYVPKGKEDKEWIHIHASNKEAALEKAREYGVIIDLNEETG